MFKTGPRPGVTLEQRFGEKIWYDPESDCILWMASTHSGNGDYGIIESSSGKTEYAHRLAYEWTVGPIPEGFVIDHFVCDNPRCVNPEHLKVVTPKENVLRGAGPSAANSRKTHCKRGHPLSGKNLLINANGKRQCRECNRIRDRRGRARRGN